MSRKDSEARKIEVRVEERVKAQLQKAVTAESERVTAEFKDAIRRAEAARDAATQAHAAATARVEGLQKELKEAKARLDRRNTGDENVLKKAELRLAEARAYAKAGQNIHGEIAKTRDWIKKHAIAYAETRKEPFMGALVTKLGLKRETAMAVTKACFAYLFEGLDNAFVERVNAVTNETLEAEKQEALKHVGTVPSAEA